jgi:hypothetical protein
VFDVGQRQPVAALALPKTLPMTANETCGYGSQRLRRRLSSAVARHASLIFYVRSKLAHLETAQRQFGRYSAASQPSNRVDSTSLTTLYGRSATPETGLPATDIYQPINGFL